MDDRRSVGGAGRVRLLRVLRLLFLALVASLLACKGSVTADEKRFDLDADPLALLPPGAILVTWVDAQALFASARLGPRLGDLADKLVPLSGDAEFVPSRDVLQVVTASYATGDGVVILHGRFNPSLLEATQTTRRGAPVKHGTYGGQATSTIGQVSFAVLTSHTAVAATGDGLRQALARVSALEKGTKVAPALPPWMVDSLVNRSVPHPAVAVVADLATQPIAAATLATLKFPWLDGLERGKALVGLSESPTHPGLHVSSTLTYADPARAEEAAKGVRSTERWLRVLGPLLGGVDLEGFEVTSQASDIHCSFAVDDRVLFALLSLATKFSP